MSETQAQVTVIESGTPYAQAVTAGRHVLTADEPVSKGGRDAGPSPYEYVLAGLGTCTLVTMRMYADRHQWPLSRAKVELWHEKIPVIGGAPASDRFRRIIYLEGELSQEQRSRLLQIAEHCPVSETLRRASSVDTTLAEPSPRAT
jgi:putative redox protein